MGLHGLYNSVNTISSMKYEGSDSFGSMIICRKGHPNIVPTVELRSPVPMSNPRAVRKLLETSSRDLSLLCDSANVYALGQTTGQYDSRNEDLFRINFTKHYTWELLHDGNALMRVVYAEPSLPRSQIDKDKFKDHLLRLFGNIDPKSVDMIWQLALEATRQKHGTMLVISAAAAAEAERLQAQSTRIQPVKLSTDLIRRLTMIDGAVLIAPDCTCYGIGVILDGLATKKGTPSRGARYNSAIRYIETIKSPTLAVVISEDGTIDLVPDLMPRISRLQISNAVEKLRKIRAAAQVDVKEFNQTMEWLREHSFYLQPKVCDEINTLRKEIEAHLEKNVAIRIIYPDFAPNEDFNESYFTD